MIRFFSPTKFLTLAVAVVVRFSDFGFTSRSVLGLLDYSPMPVNFSGSLVSVSPFVSSVSFLRSCILAWRWFFSSSREMAMVLLSLEVQNTATVFLLFTDPPFYVIPPLFSETPLRRFVAFFHPLPTNESAFAPAVNSPEPRCSANHPPPPFFPSTGQVLTRLPSGVFSLLLNPPPPPELPFPSP